MDAGGTGPEKKRRDRSALLWMPWFLVGGMVIGYWLGDLPDIGGPGQPSLEQYRQQLLEEAERHRAEEERSRLRVERQRELIRRLRERLELPAD